MYKYLIIAIAFMSIGGGGYYLRSSGGAELIDKALSNDKQTILNPPTTESVSGLYVCNPTSGCKNKYVLLLKADQTAEMLLLTPETINPETNIEDSLTKDDSISKTETLSAEANNSSTTQNIEVINTENASNTIQIPQVGQDIKEIPEDSNKTDITPTVTIPDSLNNLSKEENPNTDKGTWDFGVQNMLVITFNEHGTSTYNIPQKVVIKNVNNDSLSRMNYTKSIYEDMINPVFIKQE